VYLEKNATSSPRYGGGVAVCVWTQLTKSGRNDKSGYNIPFGIIASSAIVPQEPCIMHAQTSWAPSQLLHYWDREAVKEI
jgi:hypothetical protein